MRSGNRGGEAEMVSEVGDELGVRLDATGRFPPVLLAHSRVGRSRGDPYSILAVGVFAHDIDPPRGAAVEKIR
jgi:hypothetical protein